MTDRPSPGQLYNQAAGDTARYLELMREHGYVLQPGGEGYGQGSRTLACGWPGPQKPAEEWCIHEMAPGTCSTCAPRQAEAPARDSESFGPWIGARYPGRCSDCGERIREADQIRADGRGGWLCTECGEPS